ncbi:hypothetical protein [Nocardioides bruguierae]|uniref:Uncharacterized protein n=1 Tax=Nocardioides bruguierae TaxID=2945102 RepID=A0A9X2D8S9_9ACTN|nr:hypothetical protein [Nocardioides bruguierae]MCL8025337.1 hypothetical protein [Nocardioides bruguierae]MCM0621154.1 hypothetical protein [Nocardioides bruguierae]
MLHELWEDPCAPADARYAVCPAGPEGDALRAGLSHQARRRVTVHAVNQLEAMLQMYDHLRSAPAC